MSFFEIFEGRDRRQKDGSFFDTCDFCGRPLGPDDIFVIAKAFDKGALAMEAVQCLACQEKTEGYISEQSAENLQLYAGRRFRAFMENNVSDSGKLPYPEQCLFTGEELESRDSFELYSMHMPYQSESIFFLVGPTAVEQMSELLSEETRRFWESYMDQIQPVTPDRILSPLFFG